MRLERRPNGEGRCLYRIIFQDLCRLTSLPLWIDHAEGQKGDNLGTDPVAQAAEPVAQRGYPVAQVAEPVAHAGNSYRSAPVSAPSEAPRNEQSDDGADDEEISFLRERVEKFFVRFEGGNDPLVRERVARIFLLEHRGMIPNGTCRDVIRELAAARRRNRLRDLHALLYGLMLSRGHNLDRLIVSIPDELVCPSKLAPAGSV